MRWPPASAISRTVMPGVASTLMGFEVASRRARISSGFLTSGAYSTSAPARS